jgi:hypothetical protein
MIKLIGIYYNKLLRIKGFFDKWCPWINKFVSKGSVAIKVNDNIGRYFQTKKDLRQGNPLSPLLFNLVVDMLAILISRAKEDGQICGLVPHLVDGVFVSCIIKANCSVMEK